MRPSAAAALTAGFLSLSRAQTPATPSETRSDGDDAEAAVVVVPEPEAVHAVHTARQAAARTPSTGSIRRSMAAEAS